ncbi:MAG TPA: aldo/keto reductase [Candidatus Limnocylindria bacterium]|nr:aldo/keto reductase [Candidatus Limnocylindria bacterium]
MRSARVGRSGLTVSKLCLGTWYFGGPTPYDEALALMRAALDGGITFWDTSDHYNAGGSESVIGRGLRELGVRDEIVLATKVFYPMGPGPNDRGGGRRYLLRELDAQLKRLQTDWIDVYMLHRSDFDTPLDETIETLDACVKAGKIRYWGTSTFPAWRVAEAWWRSELRGWTHPICEEAPYNLLDRRVEADRVRFLREYGLGFFTWSSIAGGLLTGKYAVNANENPPPGTRLKDMHERYQTRLGPATLEKAQALATLARSAGLDPIHLAVAWVLQQDVVTSACIGPRTREQLLPYVQAVDVTLDRGVLDEIDRIVPPGSAYADFHDTSGWLVGPLSQV